MRSVQFQIESLLDVITFLLQKLDPEEARCFDKRIFASISKNHIEIVQNIESKIKTGVEDAASIHENLDDRDTIGNDETTNNLISDAKFEFGDQKVTKHESSKIADDLNYVKIENGADSIDHIDEQTKDQISNIGSCTESNLKSSRDETIEIKEEKEYGEQKQKSLNYKCIFCDIDLGPEFEAMKVHDEELHIKSGFYFCIEGCSYTFQDKRKIVNHFMIKHKPELMTFQCTKCDKKFPSRNIMRHHMEKVHISDELLMCKICNKKMGHPYSLRRHTEQMHEQKEKFSCHICGKEFNSLQVLKDHIECHSITEKSIQCPKCDKKFLTQYKLRVHVGEVHRPLEKLATCNQCNYKAKTPSKLRKHMSIHTSERPFSCETCGQQFKTNDILKMHKSIHTGERKYICNYCSKAFRTGTNLRTHERIHTGNIQGHCNICEKDFVQYSNYQLHMKKKHPEVKMIE